MDVQSAPDVKKIVNRLVKRLSFTHMHADRIFCMRSFHATGRARARIWSFPKIWQQALHSPSYYIIEVLAHHFDHLSHDDKIRVLIHELMHIPKNFSGALVPHRGIHKRINHHTVEQLFQEYSKKHDHTHPR